MKSEHVDKTGYSALRIGFILGERYRHMTGSIWTVTKAVWDGERDLWLIEHSNLEGETVVRSWDNFFGSVKEVRRFTLFGYEED